MKSRVSILLSGLLLASGSVSADALRDQANALFKPLPEKAPELHGQPANEVLVGLGHKLWFEPRLSRSQIVSCNSCHNLSTGGSDNLTTSIGHGWQHGPRNSPTVLNSVFNASQFWDGRAKDLQEQAKGPVQAGVEMNNTPERVVAALSSMPEYVADFKKAFPKDESPVTFDNMAYALEAFEATLNTPNAPFDRYLKGDDAALTEQQKKGLSTFITTGCTACHNGANLGGQSFFKFGLVKQPSAEVRPESDKGRMAVTNKPEDEFVFRTPALRNVALTAPYFHSGAVWELEKAISIMAEVQLGRQLSSEDATNIAAFLHSLTGEQPTVAYPVLPVSAATTPRPDTAVKAAQ